MSGTTVNRFAGCLAIAWSRRYSTASSKKAIGCPMYAMSRPCIGSIHSCRKVHQELVDEELVKENGSSARFGRK
jgi:hypothetical protein